MANFIQFKEGVPAGVKAKAKYILENVYPKLDAESITDDMILDFVENYLIRKYNAYKRQEIEATITETIAAEMITEHAVYTPPE